jgi:hypothetical protein
MGDDFLKYITENSKILIFDFFFRKILKNIDWLKFGTTRLFCFIFTYHFL